MNEPDATFTNGRYELPPHARGVLVLADPPEAGWRIHTDPDAPAARAGRGKGAPSPTPGGGAGGTGPHETACRRGDEVQAHARLP
jgi:hypothetical protein